jgi:hypothetical protein
VLRHISVDCCNDVLLEVLPTSCPQLASFDFVSVGVDPSHTNMGGPTERGMVAMTTNTPNLKTMNVQPATLSSFEPEFNFDISDRLLKALGSNCRSVTAVCHVLPAGLKKCRGQV